LLTDGDRDLSIASRLSQGLALKSANDRYEAFLELVPAALYRHLRAGAGSGGAEGVDDWDEASRIAAGAVRSSADKAMTVFELCGILARNSARRRLSNGLLAG